MTNLKSAVISKQSIKYWLALIGFILIIYFFSQQNAVQSDHLSESVAKSVMQMTEPTNEIDTEVTEAESAARLSRANNNIRKFAHFFIYMCLMGVALVFFKRRHSRFALIKATLLCSGLAVLDEVHQHFVPGRATEMMDLLLDGLGILAAIVLYGVICLFWGIGKWVVRVSRRRR